MNLGTIGKPRKWMGGRLFTRKENGFDVWTAGKIWILLEIKISKKKQVRNYIQWDTCSIVGFRLKIHPLFFAISLNESSWR